MSEPLPDVPPEQMIAAILGGDAPEDATTEDAFNPDVAPDEEDDDDPALTAWLLRLEDDIEEQRFAQADQLDDGWRR